MTFFETVFLGFQSAFTRISRGVAQAMQLANSRLFCRLCPL